jgi:hypothetical protein
MKSIEPWPSTLTEWFVLYAQSTAPDFFVLFAFKGKNGCYGKANALDVHSTPSAFFKTKEARRMWMCGNTTTHALFIHSKASIHLLRSYISASLHSNTI